MEEAKDSRSELTAKLQNEIDDFVGQLKPKKYEDGWPEDKWEEEMEKHPLFMSKPVSEGQDLPPLVEALQHLKYDPDLNTPDELAKSYKDDGNENFRLKKYRWAVESYTQGLNCKCSDDNLNIQLYTNRAAAQYHIGNYQKALKDVTAAKVLKSDHLKAIHRGVQCCLKLRLFEECISWCDEGLKIVPGDLQLQDSKKIAVKEKKLADRDKRKATLQAERQKKESMKLLKAIKERGINCNPQSSELSLGKLMSVCPEFSDLQVRLDSNGSLLWPVLMLYPEYEITDVIKQFHEDSCFSDHLCTMFSADNIPSWDKEGQYTLDVLQIYFAHRDNMKLVLVDKDQSLKAILSDDRIMLDGIAPSFYVTVKNSPFDKYFREKKGIFS